MRPLGALVEDGGQLLGTAFWFGAGGYGAAFVSSLAGTVQVAHAFLGAPEGSVPVGGLLQASDGLFYGTAAGGGDSGRGTVFRLDLAGTLTRLHSFDGAADGAYPSTSLVEADDGNLYGTASGEGPGGRGTVFRLTTGGLLTTVHAFSGPDGGWPYAGLFEAAEGSLYGTTLSGRRGGSRDHVPDRRSGDVRVAPSIRVRMKDARRLVSSRAPTATSTARPRAISCRAATSFGRTPRARSLWDTCSASRREEAWGTGSSSPRTATFTERPAAPSSASIQPAISSSSTSSTSPTNPREASSSRGATETSTERASATARPIAGRSSGWIPRATSRSFTDSSDPRAVSLEENCSRPPMGSSTGRPRTAGSSRAAWSFGSTPRRSSRSPAWLPPPDPRAGEPSSPLRARISQGAAVRVGFAPAAVVAASQDRDHGDRPGAPGGDGL